MDAYYAAAPSAFCGNGKKRQRRGRVSVLQRAVAFERLEWRRLLAFTFQPEAPIVSPNATIPNSVYGGDLDGDGDPDVVVASLADNRVAWFENLDGLGNWGPHQLVSESAIAVTTVVVADLDGDGDNDILSGGAGIYDSDVSWYANDGQGRFSSARLITADVTFTDAVFAADLDEDGDLDVLSASRGDASANVPAQVAWYQNLGDGSFGEQNLLTDQAAGARTVTAADLDGDGDMDVVAGSYEDDSVWWFENQGSGAFAGEVRLTDAADYVTRVTTGDLDGDGRTDIVLSSRDDHTVSWLQNQGNGEFLPEQVIGLETAEPYGVTVADIDGDGKLDVAVADLLADEVVWYRNQGNKIFEAPRVMQAAGNGPSSLFTVDADADGDVDVFSTSRFDNRVSFSRNDGSGEFDTAEVLTELGFLGAQYVTSGDIDGDGDLDVLAAAFTADTLSWFENLDGNGSFGDERVISSRANGTEIALLADVDSDGDNDVVSASFFDDKLAWYENLDSKGTFGPQRLISGDTQGPEYLDVADIDRDGDVDLVSSSRYDGKIAWYENVDGKGLFGPQVIVFESTELTTFVRAADIDGDGDLDLVANQYYPANSNLAWFENMNGRGAFGPQNVITLDVDLPPEADMADFDGDGDLDVVVASGNDGRLLWFENQNGDGDFDEGRLISDALTAPYSVRAVDFDGDDDQDLLVGDIAGDTLVWYENEDAAGTFGAAQSISDAVLGPSSVFAADLDGDGDVDALAALADADQIVWFRNVSEGGGDRGDFNGDGRVDIEDVDLLCGEIRSGGLDSTFDLTGDDSVNRNDMNELIVNVLDTSFGDANLDATFNSSDFVVVFQLGEYEDDQVGNSTWAEGDWNCDGDFTTTDLVLAFQAGGFEAAATPRRSAGHG